MTPEHSERMPHGRPRRRVSAKSDRTENLALSGVT